MHIFFDILKNTLLDITEPAKIKETRRLFRKNWSQDWRDSPGTHYNRQTYEFVRNNYDSLLSKYGEGYLLMHGENTISFSRSKDQIEINGLLFWADNEVEYGETEIYQIGSDIKYIEPETFDKLGYIPRARLIELK